MPTTRISFREWTKGLWLKGPTENTPTNALRRAKGVFPLRGGSIKSRSGSVQFFNVNAHSIFKFVGSRILGVGTAIYRGTTPSTETLITSTGSGQQAVQNGKRLSFMEVPAQFLATNPLKTETDFLFVSSGETTALSGTGAPIKIKTDFTTNNWGIQAPTAAQWATPPVTLTTNAQSTKTIEPFNATAGFTFKSIDADTDTETAVPVVALPTTTTPPTASADSGRFVEGTASLKFRMPKDTTIYGAKAVVVDASAFAGPVTSSDEDYISFFVRCNRPKHIKSLEIAFIVGPNAFDPTNPDQVVGGESVWQHRFERELSVKVVRKKRKKKLRATGDLLNKKDVKKYLKDNVAEAGSDLSTAEFLSSDFTTIAVSKNAWTSVTIPKNVFDARGKAGQSGYTFANVQGIIVTAETNKLGGSAVWWDGCRLTGGVGTRGDYLYTITFLNNNTGSRSNPPLDSEGNIQTLQVLGLDRQSVGFTGLPAAVAGFPFTDDRSSVTNGQVTHVEIWRNIGNGGLLFFKAGQVAIGTTTFTDTAADYIGMFSVSGGGSGTYLDPDEVLTVDNAPFGHAFRDPITSTNTTDYVRQAVYHRPSGRVFGLSNDFKARIMYTPAGRPESLTSFIEPTTPDEPVLRLVQWNETLYAVTTRRWYEIRGTDEPFFAQEVLGVPGVITVTPTDGPAGGPQTIVGTPRGVYFQAQDGVRVFDGATSRIVSEDALAPVFRGSTSDGLAAFNGVIASYGRDEYLISDVDNTTLALNTMTEEWRDTGICANALFHEPDNRICMASLCIQSGVGVAVINSGTSAVLTANTTNRFITVGSLSAGTFSTVTDAQYRIPIAGLTIRSIFVTLSAALSGGGSATFQFAVNGSTPSSAISLVIPSGDSSGSATGTLDLSQDDNLAIVVTFAGGTTSASIRHITFSYETSLGV